MKRPGVDRSSGGRAEYDRTTVEHVLGVRRWDGWHELLQWLRAEGVNDAGLAPGELRAFRQDVERASARGARFERDVDRLWRELAG